MANNLMKVVASSVCIANHAGRAIRSIMQTGNLEIVDKGIADEKFDPQTKADRIAQEIIVGSLKKQFPGINVIGEEDDCDTIAEEFVVHEHDNEVLSHKCPSTHQDINIADLVVWVDPLDGTKEFTEGHVEHVTVLIGISAHGRAIAGVIHQPFYQNIGRTMWGVVGLGGFGIKTGIIQSNKRIITTTKSHTTQLVTDTINAMKPDEVIKTGGAGYKVIQVIEGVANAYVFATPGTKKWDACAPEALVTSMGGRMTDILNEPVDYSRTDAKYHMNWTGLLVTNGRHEEFASLVPEEIKKSLSDTRDSKLK